MIKSQRDMRKEMPLTTGMLTFRKEFGNGVAISPEAEQEFNKHFEFNVLKYFDYLTTNSQSAM
jgi:hypothetical protein